MSRTSNQNLSARLHTLTLSPQTPSKRPSSKPPVADSWEDDAAADSDPDSASSSSSTETEATVLAPPKPPPQLKDYPSAPPPTPTSRPTSSSHHTPLHDMPSYASTFGAGSADSTKKSSDTRPEKTTATAARFIASALGVKAPKRTEEQKAFDRAAREKEVRRRRKEKEEGERRERERVEAVRAVWED